MEIVEFSESDFEGCQDSLKSTSGYIFMLVSGAVSWHNVKQALTASSTMTCTNHLHVIFHATHFMMNPCHLVISGLVITIGSIF